MSARSHSCSPTQATALDHTVAKWRADSVSVHSVLVEFEEEVAVGADGLSTVTWELGGLSVRIDRDFMRSATAIVAGDIGVDGVTARESGLVDER